ncbi:type II toxin-antitoxin system VapB family antitoxin [Endozoicomonas numazuensis]|uniref:Antitoxin n=1 Tax=Endozoicomonas numazuensis TaxID=1137799 RepID=A0A081N150_9GAMM|nr:type II toxin-antitoxin system VapB family antitoxin [Endozoicomonas numazuensis]KEQ12173.1 antitoxin [Endozoicomonas numazuensis]
MPSNLAIDDDLIAQVKKLGGYKTKKAAVNEALAEFVRHRQQLELLDDFGAIDYETDQHNKKARR